MRVISPHTEQPIAEVEAAGPDDVDVAVAAARAAFTSAPWGRTEPSERIAAIRALADKYGALVLVDDSHAVGVLGERGGGTPEHLGLKGRIDILTGTLGKALGGASGGYVAASKEIVAWLRQRARPYLFSNTLAPALAAAALTALDMAEAGTDLRARIASNSAFFRAGLAAAGFAPVPGEHPIIPVLIGDAAKAKRMAALLLEEGVLDGTRLKLRSIVLPDTFLSHDKPDEMYAAAGMNAREIVAKIRGMAESAGRRTSSLRVTA